jgi:ferredoxin
VIEVVDPARQMPMSVSDARRSAMKVSVDYDVCASTGACMQVCPEVFEVRKDGYLYVLQDEPGEELREKVQTAADMCPTAAITVDG